MKYPVLEELAAQPRHVVAICGGAVSGSEAAAVCAAKGITAIVFEQNVRPYGKIEDGLPRWHDRLRAACYRARPVSEPRRFPRRLFDGVRAAPVGLALTDMDWAMSGRGE